MRNYRIITKQNNMGAWGSGRSQVISPVMDRVIFKINRAEFSLKDLVPIVRDSLVFTPFPTAPRFELNDSVFHLQDNTALRVDAEPTTFTVTETIDATTKDEIDYT